MGGSSSSTSASNRACVVSSVSRGVSPMINALIGTEELVQSASWRETQLVASALINPSSFPLLVIEIVISGPLVRKWRSATEHVALGTAAHGTAETQADLARHLTARMHGPRYALRLDIVQCWALTP